MYPKIIKQALKPQSDATLLVLELLLHLLTDNARSHDAVDAARCDLHEKSCSAYVAAVRPQAPETATRLEASSTQPLCRTSTAVPAYIVSGSVTFAKYLCYG